MSDEYQTARLMIDGKLIAIVRIHPHDVHDLVYYIKWVIQNAKRGRKTKSRRKTK